MQTAPRRFRRGVVVTGCLTGYTVVILCNMKTAVSIPTKLFKSADKLAKRLGISRSELYSRAVAAMVAREEREKLTERFNAVYASESNSLDPGLKTAQNKVLIRNEW